MNAHDSREAWRHRIYRDVARFIREPNAAKRARLMLLIDSYRYFYEPDSDIGCAAGHPTDPGYFTR